VDRDERWSSQHDNVTATGSQACSGKGGEGITRQEDFMELWMWIVVALVLVLLAVLVQFGAKVRGRRLARSAHRRELRDRFGGEYEQLVAQEGARSAEEILDDRVTTYDSLEHPALGPAEREGHTRTWRRTQYGFVDSPERAVREAEHLVVSVMEERGYPTDDATQRADALSVEEPELASAYRSAHRAFRMADSGDAGVSQLLGAFLVYRELFEFLLARPQREETAAEAGPPAGDGARAAAPVGRGPRALA
jgi:hypothetical protein